MESSTLPVIVPSSLPACAPVARLHAEIAIDARSQAGVGAYGVRGTTSTTTLRTTPMAAHTIVVDQQDPNSTYNFTIRQGPPTCSPPV